MSKLRWKSLRPWLLPLALLIVTSCGIATEPSSDLIAGKPGTKQLVCLKLPVPDFSTDTQWMRNYNATWSQLGCDQ